MEIIIGIIMYLLVASFPLAVGKFLKELDDETKEMSYQSKHASLRM